MSRTSGSSRIQDGSSIGSSEASCRIPFRGKGRERKDDARCPCSPRLLQAVRSWRRRRGRKTTKRTTVTVEQLDHRQLLSVNFTGNVPVDFPASESPGVVVLPANASVMQPAIPPSLQPYVSPVSGFAVRTSGSRTTRPTIRSTSAWTDRPAAMPAKARSSPEMRTITETRGLSTPHSAWLPDRIHSGLPGFDRLGVHGGLPQLHRSGNPSRRRSSPASPRSAPSTPTPTNPIPAKPYEVAVGNPTTPARLRHAAAAVHGGCFLPRTPDAPNLEFSITHFSQLYQDGDRHGPDLQ